MIKSGNEISALNHSAMGAAFLFDGEIMFHNY